MKCPNCGIEAPADAPDCAGCGIIFAKFLAQRERERKEAAEFLARAEARPSAAAKNRRGRVAAVVLLLIWCGGLFWYYVDALNELDERVQSDLRARSRASAPAVSPR
ncbi:MAG: hypothetical protein HY403_03620 [Elusimicrobia bacterium]|nr:hypothetical protein [Elusimicrobiota bacterium]